MHHSSQRLSEIQEDFTLLLRIENSYAIHRWLSPIYALEFEKEPESFSQDIICCVIDKVTSGYLEVFGFGLITKYFAMRRDYHEEIEVLVGEGIPEQYQLMVLVLLSKGIWGYTSKAAERAKKTQGKIRDDMTDDPMNTVLQLIETEFDLRNGEDSEGRWINQIPTLEKVTFHFECIYEASQSKKISIASDGVNINPVAQMLAISIREQLGGSREVPIHETRKLLDNVGNFEETDETPQDSEPDKLKQYYKLFCYTFVKFFEDQLNLSRDSLYRIYFTLIKRTNFQHGCSVTALGQVEAYFKRWYEEGQKLQEKL